jgi:Tfp pilus assembly protein PilE
MEGEAEYLFGDLRKQYVLTDIMRKRKKDKQAVESKIKNKIVLKGKRKKSETALKGPEKFISQYRAQQKSYTHYRLKVLRPSPRTSRTRPST